jgi:hypothetical protein
MFHVSFSLSALTLFFKFDNQEAKDRIARISSNSSMFTVAGVTGCLLEMFLHCTDFKDYKFYDFL